MNRITLRNARVSSRDRECVSASAAARRHAKFGNRSIRNLLAGILVGIVVVSSWLGIRDPVFSRALAIVGICLILWLTEVVPPYVPTLLLWALTPLLLSGHGDQFELARVLGWSANPVLALFFGGFALSVAARRHGIDGLITGFAIRLSHGNRLGLLCLVMSATAILSMWMSNIAAAAMMLAALHPLFVGTPRENAFRRATLLGIALGANFGGIATPIGTGPNAIAIAAVSNSTSVTFLGWMIFALPLSLALMAAAVLILMGRFPVRGTVTLADLPVKTPDRRSRFVMLIFFATVTAWLTEPFHGTPSAIVALLAVASLFASGLLHREDIAEIDWSTLGLIAGGIAVGTLLDQSGLAKVVGAAIPWAAIPQAARLFLLCFSAALLSSLMSNTAAVTMLIPLAAGIHPAPSTVILIAIAASFGIPFAISTPPNAMIYGEGGITFMDLAVPGLILMVLGCILVSTTGPFVLNLVGIR